MWPGERGSASDRLAYNNGHGAKAQALPATTTRGVSCLQDNKIVCALVNCFKFRHVANASVYIAINIYSYIYIVAIIT